MTTKASDGSKKKKTTHDEGAAKAQDSVGPTADKTKNVLGISDDDDSTTTLPLTRLTAGNATMHGEYYQAVDEFMEKNKKAGAVLMGEILYKNYNREIEMNIGPLNDKVIVLGEKIDNTKKVLDKWNAVIENAEPEHREATDAVGRGQCEKMEEDVTNWKVEIEETKEKTLPSVKMEVANRCNLLESDLRGRIRFPIRGEMIAPSPLKDMPWET